jgi:hypothetical protein
MAKQVIQSDLLSKLGNRLAQAFEAHKTDETEYGQVELPPGIECGFGTYKNGDMAGELFFRASGVVLKPKVFTDPQGRKHRTEGQHPSIGPEPLCDTPKRATRKTLDDHIGWILNELRKMGVNTAQLEWNQLEQVCAALVDPANPTYVKFRTWRGEATPEFPNPRTNVIFVGPADPSEIEDDGEDEVTEAPAGTLPRPAQPAGPPRLPVKPAANGTAAPPRPTGPVQHAKPPATATSTGNPAPRRAGTPGASAGAVAAPPAPATAAPTPGKKVGRPNPPPVAETTQPPSAAQPPVAGDYTDQGDVYSLAELAAGGDEDSKDRLAEMAAAQGFTEEQVALAPSWQELVQAMHSGEDPASFAWAADETGEDGVDGGAEAGAADWQPEVDGMYNYRPVDGKGKPAAKVVEVVVVSVDPATRTMTLKNNNNPRLVYRNVPWDSLESGE